MLVCLTAWALDTARLDKRGNLIVQLTLIDAYQEFMAVAHGYINIQNEDDYHEALAALEEILQLSDDSPNNPLNPWIDILSQAIPHRDWRQDNGF